MKATIASDSFRTAFQGWQIKPTVILSVSTVTLITWKCFASPQYYLEQLSDRFVWFSDPQATAAAYNFLGALVLMGVIPALIVKFVFKESLADYGVCFGNRVRTVRSFLVAAPVIALISYFAARNPSFWKEYPINHHAGASPQAFVLHALAYLMFYLGWEFQFRGFMQHGLQDSMGVGNAILVQVMASVIVHLGKPVGEIYGSIVGGLIWGLLAYHSRSLLSGLLQHFLLGILLDWFICHPL
jgi:membrane protease YdiL (CAAX protease family)